MNRAAADILLVEDSARDAELARRALKKRHLANRVEWVRDGVGALDYLFRRGVHADNGAPRPRVVLRDLELPRVDGIEVLRAIRGDAALKTIQVVVLTSSEEESDLVNTYALRVNGYIVKPIDFDTFVEAVAQLSLYGVLLNRQPPLG